MSYSMNNQYRNVQKNDLQNQKLKNQIEKLRIKQKASPKQLKFNDYKQILNKMLSKCKEQDRALYFKEFKQCGYNLFEVMKQDTGVSRQVLLMKASDVPKELSGCKSLDGVLVDVGITLAKGFMNFGLKAFSNPDFVKMAALFVMLTSLKVVGAFTSGSFGLYMDGVTCQYGKVDSSPKRLEITNLQDCADSSTFMGLRLTKDTIIVLHNESVEETDEGFLKLDASFVQ